MTENEKKLIQERHRLEQAQNRNREKERKARTRRLIQEGAILEKTLPNITDIELDNFKAIALLWAFRFSERSFLSRRAHLLTTFQFLKSSGIACGEQRPCRRLVQFVITH